MTPDRVVISIDGRRLEAVSGRSLGAVLHEECNAILRRTARGGAPRGLFCGMGTCFDCLVNVDGRRGVRACMTVVVDGMHVDTKSK